MSAGQAGIPRLARWMIERVLRGGAEALLGDLEEIGSERAATRWWYWRQAIAALWLARGGRGFRETANHSAESIMSNLWTDVRVATRGLRRTPGFAFAVVITLALGIGASAAIFSVLNPVLLRSLPYPDADRLAMIWELDRGERSNTSWATIGDLSRRATSLEAVVPMGWWQPTLDGETGDAEVVTGQRVGWRYFETLGVAPALGRGFMADEDTPAGRSVVVLSDGLWRRRYGADPAILGKTTSIGGSTYTVIGVLPRGFENVTAPDAQLWRPLGYDAADNSACRTCRHLRALGRLKVGVTRERAEVEVGGISEDLVRAYPTAYPGPGMSVVGLQDDITREAKPMLLVLLGAVGFLLIAACANVAHFVLARVLRREHELAVRAALGAGRLRLAGLFLAENAVLAVLGGTLAILVAVGGVEAFVAFGPRGMPRLDGVRLDAAVVGVTAAIVLGTTLVLTLAATLATRTDPFNAMKSGSRIAGGRRRVARSVLVTIELALALMLLTGAGLMARSVIRLLDAPLGLVPGGLLTVDIQTGGPRYAEDAPTIAFFEAVRAEVRALTGVQSADVTSQMPLGGNFDCSGVHAEDKPQPNPQLNPCAQRYSVSAGWFGTTGITLRRGRGFEESDRADAAKVVVVSESLVRRVWGDEDPVGKRIAFGGPESPLRTVVGVAEDVRHTGLDDRGGLAVYLPYSQVMHEVGRSADNFMTLAVRTDGDPATLAATVRAAIHRIDATQPIARIATMEDLVSASASPRSFALLVFSAFAAVALTLAAAGIGGMLAGTVAERTREIGIRSALGAAPASIVLLIMRQAGGLAALGMAIGLAAALILSRFLDALLYEVQPADPLVLAGVTAVLASVALAACVVPARQALAIDPLEAVRRE